MNSRHPTSAALLLCTLPALVCSAPPPDQVATSLAALNAVCRSAIDSHNFDTALRLCKRVSFDASKLAPGSQAHITSLINIGDIKSLTDLVQSLGLDHVRALTLADGGGTS